MRCSAKGEETGARLEPPVCLPAGPPLGRGRAQTRALCTSPVVGKCGVPRKGHFLSCLLPLEPPLRYQKSPLGPSPLCLWVLSAPP